MIAIENTELTLVIDGSVVGIIATGWYSFSVSPEAFLTHCIGAFVFNRTKAFLRQSIQPGVDSLQPSKIPKAQSLMRF